MFGKGGEEWNDLGNLGLAAVITNGVTVLIMLVLVLMIMNVMRRVVNNVKEMTKSLPKVIKLINNSTLDMAVLIAVCEEKGTTAEELASMFKEDGNRKKVLFCLFFVCSLHPFV